MRLEAIGIPVTDVDAVRAELVGRGVEVSAVLQLGPEGAPGSRYAFFADPDGNGWAWQELPPRRRVTRSAPREPVLPAQPVEDVAHQR